MSGETNPRAFDPVEGTPAKTAESMLADADQALEGTDLDALFNAPTGPHPEDQDPAIKDFLKEMVPPKTTPEDATQLANELVDGPPEPQPTPEAQPTEAAEPSVAEEIAHLKQKLGQQGAEQGDLKRRAEEAETKLSQYEQSIAQAQATVAPATGADIARQLDPSLTDADFEDIGMKALYDRMGNMHKAAAQEVFNQVGEAVKQISERIDAIERRSSEAVAEAKVGGIPSEAKQKLEQEYPGLKDISNAEQRVAVMKALGLATGAVSGETRPASPRAPRRDPSTHVSPSGQSAPSYAQTGPKDALLEQLSRAQNATELDNVSKILQAGMKGDIDLGIEFGP